MAQDINTACNAEINNLAVEITNVAVKLIDFFGSLLAWRIKTRP